MNGRRQHEMKMKKNKVAMLEMETENGGAKEQNFFDVEAETKKKNLNINDFAVQF